MNRIELFAFVNACCALQIMTATCSSVVTQLTIFIIIVFVCMNNIFSNNNKKLDSSQ